MTSRSGCTSDPRGWETPLIRVTPGPRLMGLCPGEDGRLWAEGSQSRRWGGGEARGATREEPSRAAGVPGAKCVRPGGTREAPGPSHTARWVLRTGSEAHLPVRSQGRRTQSSTWRGPSG